MAKPYKEGSTWTFRLRIKGEDVYRNGFATEALARREADVLRPRAQIHRQASPPGPLEDGVR
jgi:hypothetical protein